ncbi:MAG: T9SS type A sorting domain-containing protein [Candidatus Kapabacteria bacterium]|nr:T9SS type A sorting domain-containing protein [Ignavibacteriota bacterium]MCW5885720.1 T9SS type A sorting domain-containing protein [Candidatus Kapabacteria bacterium]
MTNIKTKYLNLCLILILLQQGIILTNEYKADVFIDLNHDYVPVSPMVHGAFIETVHDFVSGNLGFAAQELRNRGFDMNYYEFGVSRFWWRYIESKEADYYLNRNDMYNKNGVYSQAISNSNEGVNVGIFQDTYFSDAGSKFYIYMKSDSRIEVNFMIKSLIKADSIIFTSPLGITENEWKKFEVEIPAGMNIYKSRLVVFFSDKGTLLIDEASLLPNDHVNQVRREYFDLYSLWRPGIIRYPGGTVADEEAARWFFGIGDIDQRQSPNLYTGEEQRWEVGVNEFVDFCKTIGAEPQFVTNMLLGSPKESADLVEYLNSDTSTYWGKKRAEDGNPEPYGAKYFEIGNEQWHSAYFNASQFRNHAKEMIKVDPNIHLIFGGNLWDYSNFFNISVDIAGDYFSSYGWHYLHFVDTLNLPDIEVYKAIVAGYQGHQMFINMFRDWRSAKNREDMKLSLTEIWTAYYGINWFFTERLKSFESGLWTADHALQTLENYDIIDIVNHTSNSGFFERGYDKNGKRQILGSPSFYALAMISRHSGKYYHKSFAKSPVFNAEHPNLPWAEYNVPWLRVVVSSDEDSLYLAVINKHPDEDCIFNHNLGIVSGKKVMHYELHTNHFKDRNLIDSDEPILPKNYEIDVSNEFKVKRNSINIFVIPKVVISDVILQDFSLKVYPNPAYDKLFLQNVPDSAISIGIYDLLGNRIREITNISRRDFDISLNGLASGFYILRMNLPLEKVTRTFLKY